MPGFRQLTAFNRYVKSLTRFFFVVLFLLSMPQGSAAKGFEKKVEKTIKSIIGQDITLNHYTFEIPLSINKTMNEMGKSPFLQNKVDLWKIAVDDSMKGYAILDHEKGRLHSFSFLVVFDSTGSIKAVRVLKHREEHGREIKSKRWLKQFIGKDADSSFIFGEDIDGISGATISSRSITQGTERLTYLIRHIIDKSGK